MGQEHPGCNGRIRKSRIPYFEAEIGTDILVQVKLSLVKQRHQADRRHPFGNGGDPEAGIFVNASERPCEECFSLFGEHKRAACSAAVSLNGLQEAVHLIRKDDKTGRRIRCSR